MKLQSFSYKELFRIKVIGCSDAIVVLFILESFQVLGLASAYTHSEGQINEPHRANQVSYAAPESKQALEFGGLHSCVNQLIASLFSDCEQSFQLSCSPDLSLDDVACAEQS